MASGDSAGRAHPASPTGWQARLELAFDQSGERTRLSRNRHQGPLRLLRALPLADGGCEAVIVHPPGGLVAGDRLELALDVGDHTRVRCTTPGAQKWYRSTGQAARAAVSVSVGEEAVLEWLPHPAILFDEAHADQHIEFRLARRARLFAWECLVLGRLAMGERFLRGSLSQSLSIRRQGREVWREQSMAFAGDRLFSSPLGWSGQGVCASVWAAADVAAGPSLDAMVADWREALGAFEHQGGVSGVTQVEPGLVVARLLAQDSESVMAAARGLWALARPVIGLAGADEPRIWAT